MANFFYDGTNSLGSAPLKILPSSQAFPATASATIQTPDSNPAGIVSLLPCRCSSSLNKSGRIERRSYPVQLHKHGQHAHLVFLHSSDGAIRCHRAAVSFSNLSPREFRASWSMAVTLLIRLSELTLYSMAASSPKGLLLNPPKQVSASGCNCGSADYEQIAIDDFDGDGYSDVGRCSTRGENRRWGRCLASF